MAGGKGTRLRALTNDEIPKPMAPVSGKPILQRQIEQLREQGISDIILVVGYLGEIIEAYFQDGAAFGVRIRYIRETNPLGTAGALAMLPPLLDGNEFFLVFGDVLFDIDLNRMVCFHRNHRSEATLFVHPNSHPYDSDRGLLDERERVTAFDQKGNVREHWRSNCVNAGFYLMNTDICGRVALGTKCDLEKEILSRMIAEGAAVYGYRSPEYIKDVGTVERITEAQAELERELISRKSLRNRQRAIFLDRDGTINQKNGLISCEDQFELMPGVAAAIKMINRSGYLAIVVTNQPVVARGLCGIKDVERIHQKMETLLGQEGAYLDAIQFCPHHPDQGYPEENPDYKIPCHCRKPDTGMLEVCVQRFNIDLAQSWMVGDTTVDIQTGINAGTRTALVLTGEAGKDGKYSAAPDLICDNLLQAIQKILDRGESYARLFARNQSVSQA